MLVFSREGSRSPTPTAEVLLINQEQAPGAIEGVYPPQTLNRFELGYRLHVLRVGGQAVSYAWSRESNRQWVSEIRATFGADGVWIIDCVTPPAFRGRGHYPALLWAVSVPDRPSWIYCDRQNEASRRGIEKAGFHSVGWARRRLGRLSWDLQGVEVQGG